MFFWRLARRLRADGHRVTKINLSMGDHLTWPRLGAINFRGPADRWPGFLARVLADRAVTDVVLCGEQKALHKAALPVIHDHGAQVVVTDFGYLRPDWITLELDGMSGLSRFPRDPDAIRALAAQVDPPDLTAVYHDGFGRLVAWETTTDILTWFYWFLFPHYRTHLPVNPVRMYLSSGWRLLGRRRRDKAARAVVAALIADPRPYVVFPLQMEMDFQIRAYSPYAGLREPIAEVLESFGRYAPAAMRLAVKIHPLDQGLTRWDHVIAKMAADRGLADRVVVFDGGSLPDLLEAASGVITVNSTVGIWALRAERPVLVLGDAVYDVPGLTHQGGLDGFWAAPQSPDPDLVGAWIAAVAGTIQVRGAYYDSAGMDRAVTEAAFRLSRGLVSQPLRHSDLPFVAG